ncbi:MAG: hypothetical protein K2N48_03420 [Muribaculaceae bacterium]|nr:hypothetical protein [Muribaculaceae bacterium]
MSQAPDDEVGGDGVVRKEACGVPGEAKGTGKDLVVDTFFPAGGAEGLELRFEVGEEVGFGEAAGFDGGAIEGGDDVEVEGCGGEREIH